MSNFPAAVYVHLVEFMYPNDLLDDTTTLSAGRSVRNCHVWRSFRRPKNHNCGHQSCPLDGKCLTDKVVYQATVTSQPDNQNKQYVGLAAGPFKHRWQGHKSTFNNESSAHKTTISHHIWNVKNEGKDFEIKWKLLGRASPFSPITGKCE